MVAARKLLRRVELDISPSEPFVMTDIFISYAQEDRKIADRLANAMKALRWAVWWDPVIRGGQSFSLVIEEAITASKIVVVIWSPQSISSEWVRAEADFALDAKKLLPVRIGNAIPPLRFRIIQTIDLSTWAEQADAPIPERLLEDLRFHVGEPSGESLHEDVKSEPRASGISEGEVQRLGLHANAETKSKNLSNLLQTAEGQVAPASSILRKGRDAWRERDRLELYMIACLSVGAEPALPVEHEPQLSRLRFLKDAIVSGALEARLSRKSPDEPDVWATITRSDLEFFATIRKHEDLLQFVRRWKGIDTEDAGKDDSKGVSRSKEPLVRLEELRREGSQLRNAALDLQSIQAVASWIADLQKWRTEVACEIDKIDPLDAKAWLAIDAVPKPQYELPSYVSFGHFNAYREHEFLLAKLKDLLGSLRS